MFEKIVILGRPPPPESVIVLGFAVFPCWSTPFDNCKIIENWLFKIFDPEIFHYSVLANDVIISNEALLFLFLTAGYASAPGSFIFSLRNNDDLPPFKAPLKDENRGNAIYHENRLGPIFGGGHDLHIADLAVSNQLSYTNFGYTYQPPSGQTNTASLLAGSYYFTPSEIEVLYLNWNCSCLYFKVNNFDKQVTICCKWSNECIPSY